MKTFDEFINEAKEAIQRGRELTKRYRLNRKSARAKLGVDAKRGDK
jgi:hypothetical protein